MREGVQHDVADVEVRAHPRGLELVDVPCELERAEQEFVPHLFDGDDDFLVARHRQQPLADDALRSRPRVAVRRAGVDDGRNEEDGIGSPQRGVAQRGFHPLDAAVHHIGVLAGQRQPPVIHVHHRVNAKPRLLRRLPDLGGG